MRERWGTVNDWWQPPWLTIAGGSARWVRSTPKRSRCSKPPSAPSPSADTPERAQLLITLCSELVYGSSLQFRLGLADEARAIAHRLGDAAVLVDVVRKGTAALLAPSTLGRQSRDAGEAMAEAEGLDDPVALFYTAVPSYFVAIRAGQFELATQRLAIVEAIAERLRQPVLTWMARYTGASQALVVGDIERAEQLATAGLDAGTTSGQPDAFGFYGAQLLRIRDMQGRAGELISLVAEAADQNPAIPAYRAALAFAHLEAGHQAEARELVNQAACGSFFFPEDMAWFDGVLNYAKVVIDLQLRGHADALFELLAPFRSQLPCNGLCPYEPVAMYLGGLATMIGDYAEAEMYFQEAVEISARGGMRFAEAHTNMLWGRMLRTRGGPDDAGRAQEVLGSARSKAATNGYGGVERRATVELSKLI